MVVRDGVWLKRCCLLMVLSGREVSVAQLELRGLWRGAECSRSECGSSGVAFGCGSAEVCCDGRDPAAASDLKALKLQPLFSLTLAPYLLILILCCARGKGSL